MFVTTNRSFTKLFKAVEKRADNDVWSYQIILKSQHNSNSRQRELDNYDEAIQSDLHELRLLINMQKEHTLVYRYNSKLLAKGIHLYNQLGDLTDFQLLDTLTSMKIIFSKLIPDRTWLANMTERLCAFTD